VPTNEFALKSAVHVRVSMTGVCGSSSANNKHLHLQENEIGTYAVGTNVDPRRSSTRLGGPFGKVKVRKHNVTRLVEKDI
jgi:hypothetical protein